MVTVQHPVTRNQGYGDTLALMGGDSHVSETQRQGNRTGALTWVAGVDGGAGEVADTPAASSFSHLGQAHSGREVGPWMEPRSARCVHGEKA